MKSGFILLLLSFFIISCTEEVIEEIPQNQALLDTLETNQIINCIPNSVTHQTCTSFKEFSEEASVIQTCAPDGNSRIQSQCLVKKCIPGYVNRNNNCVQQACSPGSQFSLSCTNEVSGAASAYKEVQCAQNGSGKTVGSCNVTSCLPTHFKQGNFCRPKVCHKAEEKLDCSNNIPNSKAAFITKLCNANGSSVNISTCKVQECQPGHILSGNKCLKNLCTPNSSVQKSCTDLIPNSTVATRIESCNSIGNQKNFTQCNLQACRTGYLKSGRTCLPQSCSANSVKNISCTGEITNALNATKTQTCNAQGSNATYGSCNLISCNTGYYVNNGKCSPQICKPNSTRKTLCDANYSEIAYKIYQCNSTGSGETTDNKCSINKCLNGYNLKNNVCSLQACEPNKVLYKSCHENADGVEASKQSLTCNSSGTVQTPGQCFITCSQGYEINQAKNGCSKKEIIEPQPEEPPVEPTPPPGREPSSATTKGWIDMSQAENRAVVFGSNSSTHAYAKENQTCSEWFSEKGINISKVGVTKQLKDGEFIHFLTSKYNAVPYHVQNFKPDNLQEDKCLYRVQLSNGGAICQRHGINESFNVVSSFHNSRFDGKNGTLSVDNIRAVAICDATQGSTIVNAVNKINAQYKLQIKLNSNPTTRAVLLDDRLFESLGKTYIPRGNDNETAFEFYARIGINSYVTDPAKDLFAKITHGDSYQEKDLDDNNTAILSRMSHKNLIETNSGLCTYEAINPTDGVACKIQSCSTKQSGWRPSLSCSWMWPNGTPEVAGQLRFKFEMGIFDHTLKTDAGYSLNSPEKRSELGITDRSGPIGSTTTAWLKTLNIDHSKLMTFSENLDPYHAWYKKFKTPGQTGTEFSRLERNNYCPYEILSKGDGKTVSSKNAVKACLTYICNELPPHDSSTQYVRPVTTCTQYFTNGMEFGTIVPYQGYYKQSLHIYGNEITSSDNSTNCMTNNSCPISCPEGYKVAVDGKTCEKLPSTGGEEITEVEGWIDMSQAENRAIVFGSNSSTHAYAKENQTCSEWFSEKGISIKEVGVTKQLKDGEFIHFLTSKYNATPYHVQNFKPDNLQDDKCLYRVQLSNGGAVCNRHGINESFSTISNYHNSRFSGVNGSLSVDNIRAVAICDATQGSASVVNAVNKINAQYKLQIKLNSNPTTRAVLLDDRLFESLGKTFTPRGNDNETALSFYTRLGINSFIKNQSKDLFAKITHGDAYQEKDLEDNNTAFESRMSHKNLIETNSGLCVYEAVTPTDGEACKIQSCSTKQSGWRPSLSCSWVWPNGTPEVAGQLRFKFEMGIFDHTLKTDAGYTLNSPEKREEVGIDDRSGPKGSTATAWLKSLNIDHSKLMTFSENLDPYHAWYKKFKTPGQTATEFSRLERDNYCPYEIISKGDGQTVSSKDSIKACLTYICDELPSHNSSTEYVRPVTTCTQYFTQGMEFGTIQTYQGYYKQSLHIFGNDISKGNK